jgi:hypothetical protein
VLAASIIKETVELTGCMQGEVLKEHCTLDQPEGEKSITRSISVFFTGYSML